MCINKNNKNISLKYFQFFLPNTLCIDFHSELDIVIGFGYVFITNNTLISFDKPKKKQLFIDIGYDRDFISSKTLDI